MLKILQVTLILMVIVPFAARSEDVPRLKNLSEGLWFRCEFAHSQIPPEDDCKMLDDDGFQVIKGVVHHVKILNSKETACRHKRVGNCFKRNESGLAAERSEIGPIKFSNQGAEVTWLGCMQKYNLLHRAHYIEIVPDVEQCWWTPDKRYFVARYIGEIRITSEE